MLGVGAVRRAPFVNGRVVESLMWPLAVIMGDQFGNKIVQMAFAEHPKVIEAFLLQGLDKTLDVRHHVGSTDGGLFDLIFESLLFQSFVERGGEF